MYLCKFRVDGSKLFIVEHYYTRNLKPLSYVSLRRWRFEKTKNENESTIFFWCEKGSLVLWLSSTGKSAKVVKRTTLLFRNTRVMLDEKVHYLKYENTWSFFTLLFHERKLRKNKIVVNEKGKQKLSFYVDKLFQK